MARCGKCGKKKAAAAKAADGSSGGSPTNSSPTAYDASDTVTQRRIIGTVKIGDRTYVKIGT